MSVITVYGGPIAMHTPSVRLWSGPEIAERFGVTRHSAYQWINRWSDRNGENPRVLVRLGHHAPLQLWSDEQVDRMEAAHMEIRDLYASRTKGARTRA